MAEVKKRSTNVYQGGYWGNNGAYQLEYNELYDKLVPSSGESATVNGALMLAASRLAYEFFNNGNCNAKEDIYDEEMVQCDCCSGSGYNDEEEDEICDECGGSGEYEYEMFVDTVVTEYYAKLIVFIVDTIKTDAVTDICSDIETFITHGGKDLGLYDKMMDEVMYYVLTNEDKPYKA